MVFELIHETGFQNNNNINMTLKNTMFDPNQNEPKKTKTLCT